MWRPAWSIGGPKGPALHPDTHRQVQEDPPCIKTRVGGSFRAGPHSDERRAGTFGPAHVQTTVGRVLSDPPVSRLTTGDRRPETAMNTWLPYQFAHHARRTAAVLLSARRRGRRGLPEMDAAARARGRGLSARISRAAGAASGTPALVSARARRARGGGAPRRALRALCVLRLQHGFAGGVRARPAVAERARARTRVAVRRRPRRAAARAQGAGDEPRSGLRAARIL